MILKNLSLKDVGNFTSTSKRHCIISNEFIFDNLPLCKKISYNAFFWAPCVAPKYHPCNPQSKERNALWVPIAQIAFRITQRFKGIKWRNEGDKIK